ncbi:uncharacterized protein [Mytilus edulis]|uniref:uncharacterized protein n=1 Tax=Mytilus edulis TaxID=6550 RepID=UPI0039F065A3
MAAISEEEENCVRLVLLLKGVSPRAVRIFFDREFSPTCLQSTLSKNYNTLCDLHKKRILNQAQWNILFPGSGGILDSKLIDVTLMICLIRNLTSIIPPSNGFDKLPLPGETTPGPDLARIKWYRNILAHHDSDNIDTAYFNTAWKDISDAVGRLGGQQIIQECIELKVKVLDKSKEEIILDMKKSKEEMKELKQTMIGLKIEHKRVTINLREVQDSISKLQTEHSKVTENLTAFQDSHITLQIEYSKLTENLKDVQERIKDDLETWIESDKMFFETNGEKSVLNYIKEHNFIVVTGSAGVGKSSLMHRVALTMQTEGYDIFPVSGPKEIIKWHNTEGAHDKYCALALCVMFNNSLKEKWLTENVDKDIETIINNTCEACKISKGTSRLLIMDELESLIHTFIRKDGEEYRTIHDKLFDFLAFYFGGVMIHCLIKNATSSFIRERFLFERKHKSEEFLIIVQEKYKQMYIARMVDDWSRGHVIDVYCNINMNLPIFRKRFLLHLQSLETSQQEKLTSLYDINNNSTPLIQCCFIGDIDLVKWCLNYCVVNINHRNGDGISALYMGCSCGHNELVQMLINNKADINQCTTDEASPLFTACENGHIKVVQMLLDNKADIDKCRGTRESPLYMACQGGHAAVVQMLKDNNADMNKCGNTGNSPLFIACQEGHSEVVRVLIDNKADINKCKHTGESPLFIACEEGHTEVVQILIDNKADINKCKHTGESPIYIACKEGHIKVVQTLINNKADTDKGPNEETSPLLVARYNGYMEIVELLSNQTMREYTILYIRCK